MFSPATIQTIGHYVYALTDENDDIFYIGKGVDNRVFNHVQDARNLITANTNKQDEAQLDDAETNGMSLKTQKIIEMLNKSKVPGMYIIRHSLTEENAFLLESTLIDVLDWQLKGNLTNQVAGHGAARYGLASVADIEAAHGADFNLENLDGLESNQEVLFINVKKRWPEVKDGTATLSEISRGDWRLNIQRAKFCPYAIIHANGIVKGVFSISAWHEEENNRFRFTYNQQIDIQPGNIAGLFPNGLRYSQNPIRYLKIT